MIKIDWTRLIDDEKFLGFHWYYDVSPWDTDCDIKRLGWSWACLKGNYSDAAVLYRISR